nr:MAG TPA: hypothetical protein [Caudoviricetes sp.]
MNHVKSELELSVRLGRMTLKDFTNHAIAHNISTGWWILIRL